MLPEVAPIIGRRGVRRPKVALLGFMKAITIPAMAEQVSAWIGSSVTAIIGVMIRARERKLWAPMNMLTGMKLVTI